MKGDSDGQSKMGIVFPRHRLYESEEDALKEYVNKRSV